MYRLFIIVLILHTFQINVNSQSKIDYEKHYRQLVKDFYQLIDKDSVSINELSNVYMFGEYEKKDNTNSYYQSYKLMISDSIKSILMEQIKAKFKFDLTQGLSIIQINTLIDKAEFSTDGYMFGLILLLKLNINTTIYFDIDSDIPGLIERIYLSNGMEIGGFINNNTKNLIFRPGIINDIDGYTNIRELPNIKSKIIGKINKDEIFLFFPTNLTDWWQVKRFDTNQIIGYIHKSKIISYPDFPAEIKHKTDKIRGGC